MKLTIKSAKGLEKVVNIQQGDNFTTLYISNENGFLNDVFIGASVAIDGTCLTATSFDTIANIASFDVSALTTSLTTLQFLKIGDEVMINDNKALLTNRGWYDMDNLRPLEKQNILVRDKKVNLFKD